MRIERKIAFVCVFLTAVLCVLMSGCSAPDISDSGKIKIVSTIFPGYDFASHVCKDRADVSILLPPGSESHSYEPSAQDIIKIQECDLFIYVGGQSDKWVDDILSSMESPVKTIRMMECVTLVEEEIKEGMDDSHDHAQDHEISEDYDEHVWTSPQNAVKIIEKISNEMCELDSENSGIYEENAKSYISQINELDLEFREFFKNVKNKTMIFGDRFPLRYFTEEYGIDYYAAFPGCSGETQPSASTIAFLIDKVRDEKISTVYYIEFSNHQIADSIAEQTGISTAMFHSCHNVTKEQIKDGCTYLSLMKENLETLKKSMN